MAGGTLSVLIITQCRELAAKAARALGDVGLAPIPSDWPSGGEGVGEERRVGGIIADLRSGSPELVRRLALYGIRARHVVVLCDGEAEAARGAASLAEADDFVVFPVDWTLLANRVRLRLEKSASGSAVGRTGSGGPRRLQESLRESEERQRLLLEASADPIAIYDTAGRVTYVNPAFEEVFGWSLGEVVGRPVDFVPDEAKEETRAGIQRMVREGTVSSFETRRLTKSGTLLDVQLSAATFHGRDKGSSGSIVILRDVTGRRQAERELVRAKEQAEAADRAKGQFLANMSHEIRTPMNGIIGMSSLLLEMPLGDEQRQFVEAVLRCAESLLGVINDILDFSKIESGRLELEEIDFDLRDLMDELDRSVTVEAREKGLHYERIISPDVPQRLHGDPGRLRQVLTNLIGNAVKFTRAGRIVVRVDVAGELEPGAMLRFEVADTGVGVPPERLEELFEPFVQADVSTTRKFGGTGLGLSISREIVRRMGGSIEAESREGVGSTFQFTVPLGPGSGQSSVTKLRARQVSETVVRSPGAQPSAPPVEQRGAHRVLVVEDNATNRDFVLALLDRAGYEGRAVADGFQALDALAAKDFDIVLMDVQLPGMDGLEAARRVRGSSSTARNPRIPIIALTAHAMKGDRERCLAAGMNDYLSKPVRVGELMRALELQLGSGNRVHAPPAEVPGFPAYDRRALLDTLSGDEALADDILRGFLEDAPRLLEEIRKAFVSGDGRVASSSAHALKGAAGSVGAEALCRIATALEDAADGQAFERWARLLEEAREELVLLGTVPISRQ